MNARGGVAFVVQRYGEDIAGGSESLARALAERLAQERPVTVFTTCARDYVTWRNELPEGAVRVNGVEVVRFPCEAERDLASFNVFSEALYDKPHDEADELEWLRRQGPYVPRLVAELEARRESYDAFVFFTYLYFPTYWGLRVAPERSVLVPTAHDEPALRFGIYRSVFEAPRALVFCSEPERRLVGARFDVGEVPGFVAGIGIETPARPDVEGFRIRHDAGGAYLLYAGRIDAGKGCEELLAFYERYRRDCRGAAALLLIGRLAMAVPRVPGVRYLGYLAEAEKHAALAGASAVVCPSPYESLSIVLLEALSLGSPALVSARSPVLKDHCLRSRGGLYYANRDEFVEAADLLVGEGELRRALGERGRAYVAENYRWEVVLAKYRSALAIASG